MLQEKKYFGDGSGNFDDADFIIGPNQWINMENCRVGSTDNNVGGVGYIESIGSTDRLFSTLPAGDNIAIGGTWDQVGNRLVWFNWNSNGNHGIYAMTLGVNTVYVVLLSQHVTGELILSKFDNIHSCFVLNGNLYWVDNVINPPRRINIDAGIKAYQPLYPTSETAYTFPISQAVISWIRRPPGLPPTLTKGTDGAITVNFIKFEAFQFRYRYVFRDYEVSTLSAMSALSNYNRSADTYNKADITIPFGEQIAQDVLQVDLVVRFVDGTHFIVKSWNKNVSAEAAQITAHNNGITALTFAFYNDKQGIALDSAYATKPFDSVPIRAKTCATAKNRSFFANYIAGYNSPTISSLTASATTGTPTDRLFKTDCIYQLSVTFYDDYQRKCGYIAPTAARVQTPDRIYGTFTTPTYKTIIEWTLSNASAADEIPLFAYYYSVNIVRCLRTRFFLQLRGRDSTYVRKNADGTYTYGNRLFSADLYGCAFDISTLSNFGMGYVFTEGDIFKYYRNTDLNFTLAIVAQDGNYVITELQNLGSLDGFSPFLFEIYTPYKPATEEPMYEVINIFKVNNPGQDTRQYSTTTGSINGDVYIMSRNDSNKGLYVINTVPEARNDDQDATLGVLGDQYVTDANFFVGDSPFQSLAGFNIATNVDRQIFRNDTLSEMTLFISGNIKLMPDSDRTWRMFVADNLNQQTILVPDTAMTAQVVRTFSFTATLTLAAGNRLFIFHHQSVANSMYFFELNMTIVVPSTTITYTAEAMSPNDKFYKNWNFPDTGRVNNIDTIGQVTNTNTIAYSNSYIEGTRTNGLSSFEALNTKPIPKECGPINKLQLCSKVGNEQGSVMLAICERQTASMYLGEVQLVGASANAFLAQTADVIGTINILKGNFGTTDPQSVQEYRGLVYWFDKLNGKYIQYSNNGLFPISNYKMERFWHLFSELYRELSFDDMEALGSRPFVYTGIDPYNDELLVAVPRVLEDPPKGYLPDMPSYAYPFDIWDGQGKSVVYRLDKEPNFWQGSYNIPAELFIYANDELYSFKNGAPYLHNNKTDFGNFYGTEYKSRIMFICNQNPNRPKVYNNMSIEVNQLPTLTYLLCEQPWYQASNLQDFDWDNKESILYSQLYRNVLTPAATEGWIANGLIVGERMRTIALRVMIEFTPAVFPVELRYISLGYSLSLGHTT